MLRKSLHFFQQHNHKWRNSPGLMRPVCGGLQDHSPQIDSRNVDIYSIPRSCYNHCQQHDFVRLLFYVLVKISVPEKRPKKFNAFLCSLRDGNNSSFSDLLGVSKCSGWLALLIPFADSAAWEAESSPKRNAGCKSGSGPPLLLGTRLLAHV